MEMKKNEKINFNHKKIPTFYCLPKYRNLLYINMLCALLSKPQGNDWIAGCQHRFVPDPWVFLVYQPHRTFSAYLVDCGRMSIIAHTEIIIDSVIYEHVYKPVSQDITPPIYITPYTLVA